MKKVSLSLILLVIVLSSCTSKKNKLDNAIALQLLKDGFIEHCKDIPKTFASMAYDGRHYQHFAIQYMTLKEKGLVKLTNKKYKDGKSTSEIRYTDLAIQKYNGSRNSESIAMTTFVPTEIVGISNNEEGNRAEVIFIGDFVETPFYSIITSKKYCDETKGVEKKAVFVRYDTGWRLQK